MKAKLKIIKDWEFDGITLSGTSFKYSPLGGKGMIARSEDEIVFSVYHSQQKLKGVLWIKGDISRFIPSPESKEVQDIWQDPVLLSYNNGILFLCGASKTLWWLSEINGDWTSISMDNWCAGGIPMPIAITGEHDVFPIVCRVDRVLESTNSFTTLTVDFATKTAHWSDIGSCVYSKAGTRQAHLDSVRKANGDFSKATFNYSYPLIGSIQEQAGHLYVFLESSTINPAGLVGMGYYWYTELEFNGLFKKKLWGKDNLSRLPGKHGMRGKFSGDRTWLILSSIFKTDEWKGKQKLLRLSDCTLIDLVMPRGYSAFRVLDVWNNRAFICNEDNKLALCEIIWE